LVIVNWKDEGEGESAEGKATVDRARTLAYKLCHTITQAEGSVQKLGYGNYGELVVLTSVELLT